MLGIWSLVPLPFLNPAWTSASSWFMLKPILENFEHCFASMWDEWNCVVVWTFFGVVFLWDWNENWPFPVLRPLLSFPNLLTYWVQRIHSIIFSGLSLRNSSSSPTTQTKYHFRLPHYATVCVLFTCLFLSLAYMNPGKAKTPFYSYSYS